MVQITTLAIFIRLFGAYMLVGKFGHIGVGRIRSALTIEGALSNNSIRISSESSVSTSDALHSNNSFRPGLMLKSCNNYR